MPNPLPEGVDDPRNYMREPDYVPTTNVEDIYRRWDEIVPPDLEPVLQRWVHDLVQAKPRALLAPARGSGRHCRRGGCSLTFHAFPCDSRTRNEQALSDTYRLRSRRCVVPRA